MKQLFVILSIILFFIACGSGDSSKITEDNVNSFLIESIELDSTLKAMGVDEKLDYIISNLDDSDEMIKVLATQQEIFNSSLLNDINNVQLYSSSKSKAVNMGIYGANLNYIIHFGQTQSSFKYLIASKQIADQLGVAMAFDQKIMDEYKNSTDNKDTLINIVFGAYNNVKRYMRNGEQFEMASLVIAGSWIENMYLVTKQLHELTDQNSKMTIYLTIVKQPDYLQKLIELLTILNSENDEYTNNIINGLKEISLCYSNIPNVTHVNDENIAKLHEKLELIRNSLVSL